MNRTKPEMPYAGELQVSPWDALLIEVRRSAWRSQWIDERVDAAAKSEQALMAQEHDWEAEPFAKACDARSRDLREWVKLSREERAHGANVARAAVSAGLSERYIESVQAEARMIANVLQRALQAADVSPEQWEAASEELRVALAEVGRELTKRHESVAGVAVERPAIEG
jgi:hypothetical protein